MAWGRPPAGGVGHSTSRHAEISRADIVNVSSEAGSITSQSDPASPLSQMIRPPRSTGRPRPRSTCSPPCTPTNSGTRRSGVNAANPGKLICTPLRHGKAPDRPGPNRRPGAKSHGSPSGSASSRRLGCPPTLRSDRPSGRTRFGPRQETAQRPTAPCPRRRRGSARSRRPAARGTAGQTVPRAMPGRETRDHARVPGQQRARLVATVATGLGEHLQDPRVGGEVGALRAKVVALVQVAAGRHPGQQWDQDRIVPAGQAGRLAQRVHAAR